MSDLPLRVLGDDAPAGVPGTDAARLARDLSERIDGEVRFDRHDRMLYATDASIYQVEPVGVVVPRHLGDVEETLRYCGEHAVPILARGAGTSLAGQVVNTAVVIDFSAWCHAMLEVCPERRTARVEPGIVLDTLNETLARHGLMFGPDVATSTHATLGGMIGNNSAGAHSVLYGRTVEHVIGLDVLLADGQRVRLEEGAALRDERVARLTRGVADVVRPLAGEIRRRFPRTRRRVNGYNLDLVLDQIEASGASTLERVNLAHLVCGSEGTLAITVEATLGLVEAPAVKGLGIIAFADVDEALAAVGRMLATEPAAVELIDDVIIALARGNIEHRRYVDLLPRPGGADPGAVLYVEYFADDGSELDERLAQLAETFGDHRVHGHRDPVAMARAWKLRKAGEPLLHGQIGRRKPITFIEDTAVEPEHLPEYIGRIRAIVEAHGTTAAYYAHASVGCLHVRPMICLADDTDVAAMEAIIAEVTDLVMEYGGALSGEHGDGRLRSHLLERFYGAEICGAFGAIKRLFDPGNRLNPGNIVEPVSMTERLRVRPRPHEPPVEVPDVPTFFRYEREHGFAGAVEMCNGAGVCRRTEGGTMCPSYHATRDERHATRGRGNALRLAITGQLGGAAGSPAWDDPETKRTLDLCLSCKACKSECPSNVDIAKLKAEYLAQGYASGAPIPRSSRLFARVRQLNRAAAIAPGLARAIAGSAAGRRVAAVLADVDPRRSLPTFGPSLYRRHAGRASGAGGPAVVLVPDCFAVYGESRIGWAAITSLERLGYRVILPRAGCCGRPMISNGLLADARRACRRTAETLLAAAGDPEVVGVVGCEPSCVSAIIDDWPDFDLGIDPARLRALAGRTSQIEDFIQTCWDEHPAPPAAREPVAGGWPILVHGHCHQKALGSVDPTIALLRRISGAEIRPIDAGCCGMAGAFGLTREHYELSMDIGELALFPAVRAEPDAIIAAPGTSCRHQLRDGLGREARHPIELVAEGLGVG
ncbi:MAG: FAD-binding protein [Planctomycetes bacterium]|nr:FAD-binding protein [Planctomycetota bacterium]